MAMTDAMPITIPNIVRNARPLFRNKALNATFIKFTNFISFKYLISIYL